MFREEKTGRTRKFAEPIDGMAYSIGADVAEGLALGDLSTFCVIDQNKNQVAQFGGKLHPRDFGRMLCRAGVYYNTAILVPEVNNVGISTIDAIKDAMYPQIWVREVEEIRGEEIQKRIGWHTSAKTKMKALNQFVADYRDEVFKVWDERLLKEMTMLVTEDNGNVILNGKDYVVSAMLALQGLEQVVLRGQFKAHVPGKVTHPKENKLTRMSVEEKLRYYKARKKDTSHFD
jgi:hypothetical protein